MKALLLLLLVFIHLSILAGVNPCCLNKDTVVTLGGIAPHSIAFTRCGDCLIVGGEDSAASYRITKDPDLKLMLEETIIVTVELGFIGNVTSISLSPNNKCLAVYRNFENSASVDIWQFDPITCRFIGDVPIDSRPVATSGGFLFPPTSQSIAFSPNGQWLALASGVTGEPVKVFPFDEQKCKFDGDAIDIPISPGTGSFVAVLFTSDSEFLIVGGVAVAPAPAIGVFKASDFDELVGQADDAIIVNLLALSPADSCLATSDLSGNVNFYGFNDGQPSFIIQSPLDGFGIDYSPDGACFAIGPNNAFLSENRNQIGLFSTDCQCGEMEEPELIDVGESTRANQVAYSPGGTLLAVALGNRVLVYETMNCSSSSHGSRFETEEQGWFAWFKGIIF